MKAMAVVQRMTADEYLAQEFGEIRSELVECEVVVHEPGKPHQLVVMALLRALDAWVRGTPGSGQVWIPLDVRLDDENVFAPDLLWYAPERGHDSDGGTPYPLPDLAVEVRSASTWRYDIGAKKSAYERAGLPELWLVDTAADVVLVFRRSSPMAAAFDVALELTVDDDLTSPLLPGFTCSLREVFHT